MNILKKILTKYREQISYLFWGVLTTLANFVVYIILVKFVNCNIQLANVIAWIVSVMFAYVTNRKFVFKSEHKSKTGIFKEIVLFYGSRGMSALVQFIGFPLLYYLGLNQSILGIDGLVAKIIINVVVVILNYVFSKLIVFKKNKSSDK